MAAIEAAIEAATGSRTPDGRDVSTGFTPFPSIALAPHGAPQTHETGGGEDQARNGDWSCWVNAAVAA
jgi:hypothetical protein